MNTQTRSNSPGEEQTVPDQTNDRSMAGESPAEQAADSRDMTGQAENEPAAPGTQAGTQGHAAPAGSPAPASPASGVSDAAMPARSRADIDLALDNPDAGLLAMDSIPFDEIPIAEIPPGGIPSGGDGRAPAAGDSLFADSSFSGLVADLNRTSRAGGGAVQDVHVTDGFDFDCGRPVERQLARSLRQEAGDAPRLCARMRDGHVYLLVDPGAEKRLRGTMLQLVRRRRAEKALGPDLRPALPGLKAPAGPCGRVAACDEKLVDRLAAGWLPLWHGSCADLWDRAWTPGAMTALAESCLNGRAAAAADALLPVMPVAARPSRHLVADRRLVAHVACRLEEAMPWPVLRKRWLERSPRRLPPVRASHRLLWAAVWLRAWIDSCRDAWNRYAGEDFLQGFIDAERAKPAARPGSDRYRRRGDLRGRMRDGQLVTLLPFPVFTLDIRHTRSL